MLQFSDLPQPVIRYSVGLWRRRWAVVAVAWAVAMVGWVGIWLIPDRFESSAQVFVQTETVLEPVISDSNNRPDYEKRVQVMQHALLTRPNVEEIIFRSGLDQLVDAKNPTERQVKMEGLIEWVSQSIKIESPQEMLFEVRYSFTDPHVASTVVDSVLDLFIEQDLGATLQENEDARRKIDREIKRFEARLAAKDEEIARFRRENAEELAFIDGNQRKRQQLQADISRIRDELAVAKRRLATLETVLATTPRTTSRNELATLKVELTKLRSQYKENYPDIQVIKARIAELEGAGVGALPTNPEYRSALNQVRAGRDEVAALEERQIRVSTELEALAVSIAQAPAVEVELQRIVRDYEQTEKSYEELVESRDRLDRTIVLGPGSQGVEYQVLERPRPAFKPISPPRLALIVMVTIFAFAIGAGVAMLLTLLDKSYSQTAELERAFGLPVLGGIGEVCSDTVRKARQADTKRLIAACVALFALCGGYVYWEVVRLPSHAEAVVQEAHLSVPTSIKEGASWR